MKPYFAISFLIVFMQIYALGAEETPHTDEQGSGDGTPETTISTTCKINSTITVSGDEITCDKFTGAKEISVGTHVLCKENLWLLCEANDNGKTTTVTTQEPKGESGFTPCDAGYIFHGNKCLSCSELTGESHATSAAGTATTMDDCTLPNGKGYEYQDDKGTFTYLSSCTLACTDETEDYCTSV